MQVASRGGLQGKLPRDIGERLSLFKFGRKLHWLPSRLEPLLIGVAPTIRGERHLQQENKRIIRTHVHILNLQAQHSRGQLRTLGTACNIRRKNRQRSAGRTGKLLDVLRGSRENRRDIGSAGLPHRRTLRHEPQRRRPHLEQRGIIDLLTGLRITIFDRRIGLLVILGKITADPALFERLHLLDAEPLITLLVDGSKRP